MLRFAKVVLIAAIALLAALVTQPSLAAVTTNMRVPFSLAFINPCNGDPMVDAGVSLVLATTTIDAAGIHTDVHFNEQKARDTDLLTGVECVDTGALHESGFNFVFTPDDTTEGPTGDFPLTVTVTLDGVAACPGGAGSFTLSLLAHATVNPDGTLKVFFDNTPGAVKCIGPG